MCDVNQDSSRDQHVNTFTLIGSQLVVMVLRAQWSLYYRVIFPLCGGGKKKKDDKKTKAFYDWATTGIPVKSQSAQ